MNKKISEFVGGRIKQFRKQRKLTQKELGEKIGVKHNTISSYEKGTNEPEQDIMFRLADVLGVSINDFFPYENEVSFNTVKQYTYYPTAISAGLPLDIEAITNADKITLPDSIMGKHAGCKDIVILRINGDSMDKVMPDNSLIAVKPTTLDNLNNGDIVVFSDNHDYSVKHYYRQDDTLIFKPNSNNAAHFDQTYNVDNNIVIHGKVVTYIVNLD